MDYFLLPTAANPRRNRVQGKFPLQTTLLLGFAPDFML
jgi:hypothetical protein